MDGEITPADLEAALTDDDAPLVVDIRQPGAYREGHIPGSVNLPLVDLARSVEDVADAERVVTVCPHGKASVQAANLVASYEGLAEGARVESLAGGITGWDGDVVATEPDDADGESAADAPF